MLVSPNEDDEPCRLSSVRWHVRERITVECGGPLKFGEGWQLLKVGRSRYQAPEQQGSEGSLR